MIKYTPEFNARIRKDVRHFNQVRKTLSRRGIKITPSPMTVRELKARYENKGELEKELKLLRNISSRDSKVLKEVENTGGLTAIKWDLNYLKLNQRKAIEFFEREIEYEKIKQPVYPGELQRVRELEETLKVLNLNLDYMNQEQFKSFKAYMNDYFNLSAHMVTGYRGFLWQIENAMRLSGYDNKTINSLFNKFKGLTPAQFYELYKTNNLIDRIYEMVTSPNTGNELKLTLDDVDARDIIDALILEIDEDIESVK